MEITFEPACAEDVDALLRVCADAANAEGSSWSADYPDAECLHEDIALGALYHVVVDGVRAGIIAMGELGELGELEWGNAGSAAGAGSAPVAPVPSRPCEIARFGLTTPYRGRGVGGLAIRAALDACRRRGYTEARILVHDTFARAARMYEGAGFARAGAARLWGYDFWMYRAAL